MLVARGDMRVVTLCRTHVELEEQFTVHYSYDIGDSHTIHTRLKTHARTPRTCPRDEATPRHVGIRTSVNVTSIKIWAAKVVLVVLHRPAVCTKTKSRSRLRSWTERARRLAKSALAGSKRLE